MSENNMNAFGKTDVGLMRTINQDSIFVSTEPVGKLPNLFIVADGMGGHKAGDVASREAIERFVKYACATHMSDPMYWIQELFPLITIFTKWQIPIGIITEWEQRSLLQ